MIKSRLWSKELRRAIKGNSTISANTKELTVRSTNKANASLFHFGKYSTLRRESYKQAAGEIKKLPLFDRVIIFVTELPVCAVLLGHAFIPTTKIYNHDPDTQLYQASNALFFKK